MEGASMNILIEISVVLVCLLVILISNNSLESKLEDSKTIRAKKEAKIAKYLAIIVMVISFVIFVTT